MMSPSQIRGDDPSSHELIAVLTELLDLAKRGAATGIVFGISLRGQKFYCDSAGSLYRAPVLALGVATMLVSEIEHRGRQRATDTIL